MSEAERILKETNMLNSFTTKMLSGVEQKIKQWRQSFREKEGLSWNKMRLSFRPIQDAGETLMVASIFKMLAVEREYLPLPPWVFHCETDEINMKYFYVTYGSQTASLKWTLFQQWVSRSLGTVWGRQYWRGRKGKWLRKRWTCMSETDSIILNAVSRTS